MPTPPIYTTGGTVQAGGGIYLERQADAELLAMCQSGAFAYILTSRQMGKSSLMVQTATRLSQAGIRSATVDLSVLGAQATAEQWYLGFLVIIEEQLDLETNVVQWWQERPHLGLTQRMTQFFQEILLVEIAAPVVIFVDEIDSTLSLNFTDDFFAAIRYFYVARSQEPSFHRLSFGLIGVASPSDLIRDKSRTPFNIGREIILAGFQIAEVQPLMAGLVNRAADPQAILSAVLAWTGGQPFLTQKLCQLILDADAPIAAGREVVAIEQLVRSRILENWETQDQPEHLRTIRDRLLTGGEQRSGRRLGLCQQIVQQEEVTADESPEQTELRLTGLVVKRQGKLCLYNRIYAEVFNRDWLERSLANLRPYGGAIAAWLASDRQDDLQLLRGQELEKVRAWAKDKSLGDDDRRFLDASQEREMQTRLAAEQEANQILTVATQKANRRNLISLVGAAAALVVAAVAVPSALLAWKARDVAQGEETKAKQKTEQLAAEKATLDESFKTTQAKEKEAEIKANEATQKYQQARIKEKVAQQQYQQAQQQVQQAQTQLTQVNQGKALAEQAKIEAQQQLFQVNQAKEAATQAKEQANLQAKEAIQALQSAQAAAKTARQAQAQATTELAQVQATVEVLRSPLVHALEQLKRVEENLAAQGQEAGNLIPSQINLVELIKTREELQASARGIGIDAIKAVTGSVANLRPVDDPGSLPQLAAKQQITQDATYAVQFLNRFFNFNLPLPPIKILDKDYLNAYWDGQSYNAPPPVQYLPDVTYVQIARPFIEKIIRFNYRGQSGALGESYADILASLIKQQRLQQTAQTADWTIAPGGIAWILQEDIPTAKDQSALRSLKSPGTAYDSPNPILGKDAQVAHIKDLFQKPSDNGGVHINSGIPNKAFYETAIRIGSDKAGQIWSQALLKLNPESQFQDAASTTYRVASNLYGENSIEHQAVKTAWEIVGISPI